MFGQCLSCPYNKTDCHLAPHAPSHEVSAKCLGAVHAASKMMNRLRLAEVWASERWFQGMFFFSIRVFHVAPKANGSELVLLAS